MAAVRRLLIAEDDANDRRFIRRGLARAGLHESADFVDDGQQALEYLERMDGSEPEQPRPAAVLMDIKMPRLTGLQVLERIRQRPRLRNLPVVLLTSSSEPSDVARAYALGANAFVVKPADLESFIEAVVQTASFWVRTNEPPGS